MFGSWCARAARSDVRLIAFCVFLTAIVVYNANLRQISSDDTRAARYVPISLLREGNLALDEFFPSAGATLPYYLFEKDGHRYDSYPLITPLIALPVYIPLVYADLPLSDYQLATFASKVAASVQTAAAVAVFFLLACRMVGARRLDDQGATGALFATAVLALGTSLWSTASQGLYTHPTAALGMAVALHSLLSGRPLLAGLAAGMAASARPALALAAAILAGAAWFLGERSARPVIRYAAGVGILGLLTFGHKTWLFGDLGGGDIAAKNAVWLQWAGTTSSFGGNVVEGFVGSLVNPSRGLLVHSPILLFALAGVWRVWRVRVADSEAMRPALVVARVSSIAALAVALLYGTYIVWWGAHGYGAKYLTDVLPLLGLMVPFGVGCAGWCARAQPVKRKNARRSAVAILLLWSIGVQVIGVTSHPSTWLLDKNPPYYERLWDWRYNQIVTCLRDGPRLDPASRSLLVALGWLPPDPVVEETS